MGTLSVIFKKTTLQLQTKFHVNAPLWTGVLEVVVFTDLVNDIGVTTWPLHSRFQSLFTTFF